jgi:prepilin-type N-terminal cleavage/methylation domain-containing protein
MAVRRNPHSIDARRQLRVNQLRVRRARAGFTLLEMLIATGIFLFGFMAVYALFLIGVESRQQAEQITRTSIAADAMLEDWRLRFSHADYRSKAPQDFIGDGIPFDTGQQLVNGPGMADRSFAFSHNQPGVLYRVISCSDLSGDATNTNASALYLELLVLYQPGIVQSRRNDSRLAPEEKNSIPYTDLVQRLPKIFAYFRDHPSNNRERDPNNWATTAEDFEKKLIDDGIAQRYQTVINRTRLAGN